MTIWILAILLLASLAALGYRQGAIRVAFSLIGILLAALLAVPLGKPFVTMLKAFGVEQPVVLWMLPPFIAFCVVSALFKVLAQFVHHKVEVYFKYKAGDLRLSLWERLNHRVGLSLGIVNGVIYVVLISFVIYIFSYWTVQMDTSGPTLKTIQLVNRLGRDLQETGFNQTARALDRMPQHYYDAADIVGLLYQNSLLEARLSRYPAFLMLGERPEFQALANDKQFSELRMSQASVSQLLQESGSFQALVNNPETLTTIWGIAEPNLKDLRGFLETGRSEKFDLEPILGRWSFNVRATAAAIRKTNPNITSKEMQIRRRWMEATFAKTRLVIGTDYQLVVKDFPNLKVAVTPTTPLGLQSGPGQWEGGNGKYRINFTVGDSEVKSAATAEVDRLSLTIDKFAVVFDREY